METCVTTSQVKYPEFISDEHLHYRDLDLYVPNTCNIPTPLFVKHLLGTGILPVGIADALGVMKDELLAWLNPSNVYYNAEFARAWELGLQKCHIHHLNVALEESKRRGFNFKGYQDLISMELDQWRDHVKDVKDVDVGKSVGQQILEGANKR
jgi:hypothetical protein